ncbi:MAG: glycosyltransferase family 2 protein [Candidatus Omnitrophota bacterium]
MNDTKRCDIIIPIWNQLEETRACIDSIKKNTDPCYRLILVDNASGRETAQYLENCSNSMLDCEVTLLKNGENLGFIKAVNRGISVSQAPYVCVLNNDTIVLKGWLKEAINVFQRDAHIGIVNPSSNSLGQPMPHDPSSDKYLKDVESQSGKFVDLGSAFGFCMLIRRTIFEEIGLFDETYGMGYFEDTDFSLRAKAKGYRAVRSFASYVYHKESRSFSMLGNFKRDFEKNKMVFESKWGATRRLMFVFDSANNKMVSTLNNILKKYARAGYWVYVVSPRFDTKVFFERYSNLTFYHADHLLSVFVLYKVLFKKKRADLIYVDNSFILKVLKLFKICHGAEIKQIEEI